MSINAQFILEMIGYLGSALVIVSMLMTSVIKLRVINTIGGVIFCGYALCIHSYPTAAMQVCLIVINIVNLYKLKNIHLIIHPAALLSLGHDVIWPYVSY